MGSETSMRALEAFSTAIAPALHLHSAVAMELLSGATSAALRRRTETSFIRPFERRGRVITPGHVTWKLAGAIIADLIAARRLGRDGFSRSFVSDCVIAASAREYGFVQRGAAACGRRDGGVALPRSPHHATTTIRPAASPLIRRRRAAPASSSG
jgi:predicted nucleic acid-binding protein